jgi:hypothetical protein
MIDACVEDWRSRSAALITGRQLNAARILAELNQLELAKRARVAVGTIRRMEAFDGEIGARTHTLSKVKATLEKAGVEFIEGPRMGVMLKEPGRSR